VKQSNWRWLTLRVVLKVLFPGKRVLVVLGRRFERYAEHFAKTTREDVLRGSVATKGVPHAIFGYVPVHADQQIALGKDLNSRTELFVENTFRPR
jgi:hypothetical protein